MLKMWINPHDVSFQYSFYCISDNNAFYIILHGFYKNTTPPPESSENLKTGKMWMKILALISLEFIILYGL